MRVLSISFDRAVFDEKSEARERLVMQAREFDELHVVVFSRIEHGLKEAHIAPNIWLYPTDSGGKWLMIRDAIRIGRSISENCKLEIENSRDLVITSQDPFESGMVAEHLSDRFATPFQIQVHTDLFNPYFASSSLLNRIRAWIARRILPKADGIRVVSSRIARSLEASGLPLKASIETLPVFVDRERFRGGRSDFLKQKYQNWQKITLMVSRLSPEKDLVTALHAFAEVARRHPNFGLVIVGEGAERPRLEACVRNLSLEQNVAFEGVVSSETTLRYYQSADLFLNTSRFEGFGRTLLEAAVSRLAVVSTDCGIAPDLLGEGVIPVGDRRALASRIESLLTDESKRREQLELQEKNLSRFSFDTPEAYAKKYAALLRELI